MDLEIDAFHVLRRIASELALAPLRAQAAIHYGKFIDALRKLLVKRIKTHGGDLEALRAMRVALGAEAFDLVVEGMRDSEIKTLVNKLDRHHPGQKAAGAIWLRGHFRALVGGAIEPAPAPAKKEKAAPKPKVAKQKPAKEKPARAKGGRAGRRRSADESDYLDDPSAGATRDPERS